MLSAELFAEVKRKEMEQGSEKHGEQAVDVAMERSNDQGKELTTITLIIWSKHHPMSLLLLP
ncbi:hypothetical protein H5410_061961 [Solanum commersonii]|uniref:Uncharacterized protein n=1 Tax=Solanum commersonii TaxID=4109 RepID=A0A9J5W947_SOLCO|nr:hypothetical protein H5410_061961 [Solanum commersonii]